MGDNAKEREPKQPKPARAKFKELAKARRSAYYKLQVGRTDSNKQRRLGKQIRRFPNDVQAQMLYVERYGAGRLKTVLTGVMEKVKRRALTRSVDPRMLAPHEIQVLRADLTVAAS